MNIAQTVIIPASHRLTIDVPPEVPAGPVILTFTPQAAEKAAVRDVFSYRTGFLKGQVSVPSDFDTMGRSEIAALISI